MNLSGAVKIAEWLEETYLAYIRNLSTGMEPQKYPGERSGNWDSGEALRVSKIAKDCPRYSAMEHKHLVEPREFTDNDLVKFEDAVRAAEVVYEAINWGCSTNYGSSMMAEYRVLPGEHWSGLVGTIDVKFNRIANMSKMNVESFPIEVKRTDNDKYWGKPSGVSLDQFIQVIGEMILLGEDDWGSCEFGFLFCRYGFDSNQLVKVWIVRFNSERRGWFLYDHSESVMTDDESGWLSLPSGSIFMSVNEYMQLIQAHKGYRALKDPMDGPAPYEFLENWRCAKKVKAQYYSPNGSNKGRKKDGTGLVIPRCPLFHQCFGNELVAAGFDISNIEYPLEAFEGTENE